MFITYIAAHNLAYIVPLYTIPLCFMFNEVWGFVNNTFSFCKVTVFIEGYTALMKYVNIHTYNICRTIAVKCFAQKKGFYNVLI